MDNLVASNSRATFFWRGLSFPLVSALFGYSAVLFVPAVLNDPDTYWHIETGRWILEHHTIPRVDPFSFSMSGQPWIAHEWLSEVLMALAARALGWNGIVMLFGAAAAMTFGCLAQYLAQRMHLLAAAFTVTLGAVCVCPSLLARPHLLALPLVALWTIGLLRAQETRGSPPWRILPLMLIWANLHASFIFGLGLIGPVAVDALVDTKCDAWRIARSWTLFFSAALATALITPQGWHGLLFPFQLASMQLVSTIGEWRPIVLHRLEPIELALVALLYVIVSWRVRMSAPRFLILAGLLYMSYRHVRHEMLAGIVGAAVLAEPLGRAFGTIASAPGRRGLSWYQVIAALACAASLTGLRFAHPVVRGDGPISPVTALAAVPADLQKTPVFNSYEFGGYLIFRHVRPFIDGRADMYGDVFMSTYLDAARPERATFERVVKRYRVRWALLATPSAVAQMVATLPGWRRIYRDDVAAVFVREEP